GIRGRNVTGVQTCALPILLPKYVGWAHALFREHGPILRTSEALEVEIHNRTLYYMLEEGHITKLERGLYKLADEGTLSNPSLTKIGRAACREKERQQGDWR